MSDKEQPDHPPGFSETAHDTRSDHAYEIWVRRKIQHALKRSVENPKRYSLQDVMRRFGIES